MKNIVRVGDRGVKEREEENQVTVTVRVSYNICFNVYVVIISRDF